jgi:glutamate-ammonia-ligase adenylyltransferase
MRDKLAAQFPGKNRWDLKFAPGGLVDIEFVAQTLQLVTRSAVNTNTVAALQTLAEAGAINGADAQTLISTARIENALTQVLRIAVEGTLEPAVASQGLKALLVRAAGARDFEALEESLAGAQARVREIFNHVVRAA